jgi:hypothetical protein
MEGAHRADDHACPNRGEDQTGLNPEIYETTHFEPQDYKYEWNGIKVETLEGRTLFDDYFLAVLQGVSTSAVSPAPEVRFEEIPAMLVNFSYEVATAAMKKREEYFAGEKHERS